ncbi:MAG TPA: extracellular solute-binding protein, partial [Dehalococcoidia bacterium]|nr:extracellular solute-binding protein [Dehalococcoidia bacterium]
PFQKKYGIEVEFLGQRGAEFGGRVRTEREAGQYLWDIYIGGTTTAITGFKEIKALDAIEPTLVLPEAKDLKSWKEGRLAFADKDRLVLSMVNYVTEAFCINSSLAKAEEFKSYRDLLDPKWKGKLMMHDPRISGAGQAKFHFFYVHPQLGPDFIRALLRQEPEMAIDQDQMARWLAEGRAPIQVGCSSTTVEPLIEKGVPLKLVDSRQMKEGGSLHVGVGSVALFNRAPHPNAAKVYLNWLLTKEGQTEFSKAVSYPSRRVDVPTDHVNPWEVPVPGASYIGLDDEDAVWQRRNEVLPFLEGALGRR